MHIKIERNRRFQIYLSTDKARFQHNTAYSAYKDLARQVTSDEVLRDKTFQFASNPQCYGYQRGFAWMVYKFFDIKFGKLLKEKKYDKSTIS